MQAIPFASVEVGSEEERLVLELLRSKQLTQGPMVSRLEEAFASVAGTRHAVAVTSGTTALVAALTAIGVGPGDTVITSPLTFGATLNAILETGATARFVDIGDDFTLDPDAVAAAIDDSTKVLLPVHLYGLPADMTRLGRLAADRGLTIVEDAAQAVGAAIGDRPVGSFGLGCFSLYATKNVMSGEGGMITLNDDALASRLRILRNQGMVARYDYMMRGHNWRMTGSQAAVGVAQTSRLSTITAARRANAAELRERLTGLEGLVLPDDVGDRHHVYHQFTVQVTEAAPMTRDALAKGLAAAGIGYAVIYPRLVFDYPCFRNDPRVLVGDLPAATRLVTQVLSLPAHPGLEKSDLDRIASTVRSLWEVHSR